jgi:hypothetical protein
MEDDPTWRLAHPVIAAPRAPVRLPVVAGAALAGPTDDDLPF